MNLKIEYEGESYTLQIDAECNYMKIVDKILNHLHLYIYAVQSINIFLVNGEEHDITQQWDVVPSLDEIELVVVYPRSRDEHDKVLPSPFVESYIAHQRQLEDERIAREMQEIDYGIRRRPQDGSQSGRLFQQIMASAFLSEINRNLEENAEHDDDDEDDDGPPFPLATATPFPLPLATATPLAFADGDNSIVSGVLQTLLQAMRGGRAASQEDVKVVCTQQEVDDFNIIKYGEITEENNMGDTCNICLEEFDQDTDVLVLPQCKHYYHPDCIKQWILNSSNKCPVCRVEVGTGTPLVNLEEDESYSDTEPPTLTDSDTELPSAPVIPLASVLRSNEAQPWRSDSDSDSDALALPNLD